MSDNEDPDIDVAEPVNGDDASHQGESQNHNEKAAKDRTRRRVVIAIVAVAATAALVALLAVVLSNSDDDTVATPESGQSAPTSSSASATVATASTTPALVGTEPAPTTVLESLPPGTTSPTTNTPTTSSPTTSSPATSAPEPSTPTAGSPTTVAGSEPPGNDPLRQAVWPSPDSDLRYSDPVEAARAFATEFVGFVGANFGEFRASDNDPRSGEVEVRVGEVGATTVVFVSQLSDDDTWWVTGSGTQDVVVQQPDALTPIDSPLSLNGLARSSDGRVKVQLRADNRDEPLFDGFVPSGTSDLESFEKTFQFDNPGVGGGSLLFTIAGDNANVLEAEVVRYFFQPG